MGKVHEQLVRSAMEMAKKDIDGLASLVSELAKDIGPGQKRMRRKWGRVQVVLKGPKIVKLRNYIENAKSTLYLLQASRTQSAMFQMNGTLNMLAASFSKATGKGNTVESEPHPYQPGQETSITAHTSGYLRMGFHEQMPQSYTSSCIENTTTIKSIEAGVGLLSLRSTSSRLLDANENAEAKNNELSSRTTFVVNLLWRFASCRRGFRVTTTDTFDSWSFNTIRRRPNDSPIFKFCELGDTRGVREFLTFGKTSIYDVNASGATLLHYACRYGRSDLARFLIDCGSDILHRCDNGYAPMDDLENLDRYEGLTHRLQIAKRVDAMIRYSCFDPFDWKSPEANIDTLTLWSGLPREIWEYLLTTKEIYHFRDQRATFILDNMIQMDAPVEDHQECVDLLLRQYEKFRSDPSTCNEWLYNSTLLQYLLFYGMDSSIWNYCLGELKISRALQLTNDLYRCDKEGTALDTVAKHDVKNISNWLSFLSQNGVDVRAYLQYEKDEHLDGKIYQGSSACCRIINVEFISGQSDDDLRIESENICDPQYEHLDPEYRCDKLRRRELCISQMDPAFIDDAGKPMRKIPGSWDSTLKPNSERPVALRDLGDGWQYMDFLQPWDSLYEETIYSGSESDSNTIFEKSEDLRLDDSFSETDTPSSTRHEDIDEIAYCKSSYSSKHMFEAELNNKSLSLSR